jgi:hypothetical protein
MKQIKKEEVFGNFRDFLKTKGIELQEGPYTQRIRQSCEIVADSVNLSQRALRETKSAVNRGLDHLRQVIHEHTAPKPAGGQTPPPPAAARTAPAGGTRKKAKPVSKRAAKTGNRRRKS